MDLLKVDIASGRVLLDRLVEYTESRYCTNERLQPDIYIHYAAKNQMPDSCWRIRPGLLLARARGKGPLNVLISTDIGTVVVPYGNVRRLGGLNK